jgi:hypothetical protein
MDFYGLIYYLAYLYADRSSRDCMYSTSWKSKEAKVVQPGKYSRGYSHLCAFVVFPSSSKIAVNWRAKIRITDESIEHFWH